MHETQHELAIHQPNVHQNKKFVPQQYQPALTTYWHKIHHSTNSKITILWNSVWEPTRNICQHEISALKIQTARGIGRRPVSTKFTEHEHQISASPTKPHHQRQSLWFHYEIHQHEYQISISKEVENAHSRKCVNHAWEISLLESTNMHNPGKWFTIT